MIARFLNLQQYPINFLQVNDFVDLSTTGPIFGVLLTCPLQTFLEHRKRQILLFVAIFG